MTLETPSSHYLILSHALQLTKQAIILARKQSPVIRIICYFRAEHSICIVEAEITPEVAKQTIPNSTIKLNAENTVKGLFDWPMKRTYATSYDIEYIPPNLLEPFLKQE